MALPASTAVIILAVIAAVYFAITAVFAVCILWCLCSRKAERSRVKPASKIYKSPRASSVECELDSLGGFSRATSSTEVNSVVTGFSIKTEEVPSKKERHELKKKSDPYPELRWEGGRESPLLKSKDAWAPEHTIEMQDSPSSSTHAEIHVTEAISDTTSHDSTQEPSPRYTTIGNLSSMVYPNQHTSKDDGSLQSSEQCETHVIGNHDNHDGEDDDDEVFTETKENMEESHTTSPTFEETKRKAAARQLRKKKARTDSTKPLLNGSERTISETSDFGYEAESPPKEYRSLSPVEEIHSTPNQLNASSTTASNYNTPLHTGNTPHTTSFGMWATPKHNMDLSSIARERPRPKQSRETQMAKNDSAVVDTFKNEVQVPVLDLESSSQSSEDDSITML